MADLAEMSVRDRAVGRVTTPREHGEALPPISDEQAFGAHGYLMDEGLATAVFLALRHDTLALVQVEHSERRLSVMPKLER